MTGPEHVRISLPSDATGRRAIETINAGITQVVLVVDEVRQLIGTVTNGDIRGGSSAA